MNTEGRGLMWRALSIRAMACTSLRRCPSCRARSAAAPLPDREMQAAGFESSLKQTPGSYLAYGMTILIATV